MGPNSMGGSIFYLSPALLWHFLYGEIIGSVWRHLLNKPDKIKDNSDLDLMLQDPGCYARTVRVGKTYA